MARMLPARLREMNGPRSAAATESIRGDANASGVVDISDAIATLELLFLGGAEPPCIDAGDSDDSGELDISDGVNHAGRAGSRRERAGWIRPASNAHGPSRSSQCPRRRGVSDAKRRTAI